MDKENQKEFNELEKERDGVYDKLTMECSICLGTEKIRGLEVENKVKGLLIKEYKFICEECLKSDFPKLWEYVKEKGRKEE